MRTVQLTFHRLESCLFLIFLLTAFTSFEPVSAQQHRARRAVLLDSTAWIPQVLPIPGVVAGDAVFFDYDNDGRLDIMMAGESENGLVSAIYRNDSASGFTNIEANLIPVASERGVAWGDFDNDGDYDIALEGNATPEGGYTPVARIYRNDSGSFVNIHAPLLDLNGGSVSWVDYNNDGRLELFTCGSNDLGLSFYSKLYRNIGGTFSEDSKWLPGVWGSSVAWADFDKDGDLDVVISGYGWGMQTRLFRNDRFDDTTQIFNEIYNPVEGGYPLESVSSSGVAWFDYDNDGWPDLLVTGGGYSGSVSKIYRNNHDGQFHDIGPQLSPVQVSSVAVGDYDNDGFPDIALSGGEDFTYGSNPTTRIYHNNGDGAFTDIHANLVGTWFGSLEWGDYDKDGRLDLLVTGATIPRDSLTEDGKYLKPATILYRNTAVVDSNAPPGTPSGAGASLAGNTVDLSWGAAPDAETPPEGVSYNVRIGTSPGGIDVMSPLSNTMTGFRRAPRQGNAGARTSTTVRNLLPGTYYWSVQSVDNGFAASQFSPEQTFTVTSTSVGKTPQLPASFALEQNYPNPFNPTTVISYSVPPLAGRDLASSEAGGGQLSVVSSVRLVVYDILGREVAVLVNEVKAPGIYEVQFDASNLSSGVYYYRLSAGRFEQTRSLVVVR